MMQTDIDFQSNCIFIDESAFHTNLSRTMAWSTKGTRATVVQPKTINILEAISLNVSFRTEVFGKATRLSSSVKDFPDGLDAKKLMSELSKLVDRENGAASRTIESLGTLANKVTRKKKKKEIGQKKVENILEAVWGCLFRVTNDYDACEFDNALFPASHPLANATPTTLLKSVLIILQHSLKCVLTFQVKVLEVTCYLCFRHFGTFVMTEIEVINFPSTIDEYCQFGASLYALLNVCSIHEQRCQQQKQEQQQQEEEEIAIFLCDVLKTMYELSTSKHTTQVDRGSSSTGVSTILD
ncbi:hypothetical protein BD560DRAFT_440057 [Blakeslea trispora]|nr:hypothetical protein BD560DRAFT_440057 [Blakeslea trispora]